jgi:hypothetical protein
MPDQMQGMPIGTLAIKRVENPNRPVIYSNNVVVTGNQWDFQLYFSLVHEVSPGTFGAVEEALVILTPEHALALSKALQRTLETFAQQQGAIREIKSAEIPPAANDTP